MNVYFAQAGDLPRVKIGMASDIHKRLASLQIGCPLPIKTMGVLKFRTRRAAKAAESILHKTFKGSRMAGEWFQLDAEVHERINEVLKTGVSVPRERRTALQRAVKKAGGQTALAKALGVKQPVVANWLSRQLPAEWVLRVEEVTGVSRHDLSPKLYPRSEPPLAF